MSNEELKGCQAPGSALEKIRRAVAAVKAYNDSYYGKDDMWKINTSVIEELSGSHSKAVREYVDSTEGRLNVEDYNQMKGFGYHHNKGKGCITDFIKLF